MNVKVTEGKVRVSNGSLADTLKAGEIARITADGQIRKKSGLEGSIVDATGNADSSEQSVASNPRESTAEPTIPASSEPIIEYVTKEFYYIAGYVLNEDGDLLANSQITCRQNREGQWEQIGETHSNQDGYFLLEASREGAYRLISTPPKDYYEETQSVQLTKTNPSVVTNFIHKPGSLTVKGKVIEKQTSEPIAGAEVQLCGHYEIDGETHYNPSAMSENDGTFIISNLGEGSFYFHVCADGYIDYDAKQRREQEIINSLGNIQLSSETQYIEYTIKMEKGGAVTVHVVDTNQSPVPDVNVKAHPAREEYGITRKNTDSNGICEFTNIPHGKVLFQAGKEGYGESFSKVVETGDKDSPAEVTLVLGASSSIAGRIFYKDGSPAVEWTIYVHNISMGRSINTDSFHSASSETDENGEYTIEGLGEGEYKFFLSKHTEEGTKRIFPETVISLKRGEQKSGVDYEIHEGAETVSGKVIAQDGSPIAGARVEAHAAMTSAYTATENEIFSQGSTITGENGEFTIEKINKSGGVMVSVEAEGYQFFRDGFRMGEFLTITLKPSIVIAGMVLDQSTRNPIAGASVILRNRYTRDQCEMTYANGAFKFSNFGGGVFELFAFADGYAFSEKQQIDTDSESPYQQHVIELEKANEYRGIVVDPEGHPVAGAEIGLESCMRNKNIRGDYRGIIFLEPSLTREDGSFIIPNRSRRPDALFIRHPQFAMTKHSLPAEWTNEDPPPVFPVTLGGTIEGVVLDEEHKPVVVNEIHCLNYPDILFGAMTSTDPNGCFRIDHLPAAEYTIHGPDFLGEDRTVQVQDGQTTRVNFIARQ